MRIKLSTIWVNDQDKAKKFYSEVLGFVVTDDSEYGPEGRWLTVASEDTKDMQLLLASTAQKGAKEFQETMYQSKNPATSFVTTDIQGDYERLKAKGVTFTMTPTKMDYGGTDALFDDTCGNLINLHQE